MTRRLVLLDSEVLEQRGDFERILVHEIFHFAWLRLGNKKRRAFEQLVSHEIKNGARGELGWSAESRRRKLTLRDRQNRTRRWREYCCESFCDTGAWLYSGVRKHDEFTLALRLRKARRNTTLTRSSLGSMRIRRARWMRYSIFP